MRIPLTSTARQDTCMRLDHVKDLHSTVAIAWSAQQWIGRNRLILMQQGPFIEQILISRENYH
ncbi:MULTISPECIES: hypothetical protein [unclassified Cupriavidus]|uniref:hypothetical protein n=1 Tax=unclassified Cupriavidus TaxID=2640874 RepID=UPI00226D5283|nr:hypothetical protein [Cupriavidus sp. D39]MCY0854209.1 hypothetical protein [Cupriavidus sp. D39]